MHNFAGGIAETQIAVVQFQRTVGLDEAHVIGIEAGKVLNLREVGLVVVLEQVERELRVAERLGQALEDFVALRGGEEPCSRRRAPGNPRESCGRRPA